MLVDRTVSRWENGRWDSAGKELAAFREAPAYVLLGEAGSGKTTSFREESRNGAAGRYIPARRFARRLLQDHSQWRDTILFIDGLDETRIGAQDPRKPLDALLGRLEAVGCPRFRLSCREEYWLGDNDLQELKSVTNGEEVHLLRLDPLSLDDTRQILAATGTEEPDEFIWTAIERGLESFLSNPLLLEILTKAGGAGLEQHPRDIFHHACRHLVEETNRAHMAATDGGPYSTDQVLLAAGKLSALLLFSGKSGWSRRGPGSEDTPPLSDAGKGQPLLKCSLDTKLFEGSTPNGRLPRHRRIAEFLAAGYVDHAIRSRRLTGARALRLLQGIDGVIMPHLRGISAWLAAMNCSLRRPLIETDPVGVAFLGDASGFNRRDTERLLQKLESQLEYRGVWPAQASLAALATGPARQLLWELLQSGNRTPTRRKLVELLLRGMAATPVSVGAESATTGSGPAAKAREMLSTVVRDPTWEIAVRNGALSALIRITGTNDDGPQLLAALLRELDEGSILGDKGGELRGQLRSCLYPRHLAASEIWDYADRVLEEAAPSPVLLGPGWKFWTKHLVDGSSPKDIRILLDTLAPRANRLNPLLAQNGVESVILRLLARGLELFGDKEPIAKLHDWFELVENDHAHTELVPAHCKAVRLRSRHERDQKRIHGWLRCHPEIQLGLILEGVKQHATRQIILVYPIGLKFLGKTAPPNFREWCLTTAIQLAGDAVVASEQLALWAATDMAQETWGPPLSDEYVAAAIKGTPALESWNGRRIAARALDAIECARQYDSPSLALFRERQQAYIDSIQEHLPTIQEGEGPPGILHELGRVYLSGLEAGGADQAHEDLRWHLRPDFALVAPVTEGFRRLSRRRDLPTLKEITKLHRQGRVSLLAAPFLAGLCEEEAAGSDPLQHLDKEGLSRALGFYLLSGLPTRRHPDPRLLYFTEECRPRWFRLALKNHPQVVANAFVAVHRVRVAVKEAPDQHVWDLAKAEYEGVARLALPAMVKAFPSRCTEPQVESLRPVLRAALRYMAPDLLGQHVLRRIARTGMDNAQRMLWLAAGLFVERKKSLPSLLNFVADGSEAKLRRLVQFLAPDGRPLPDQDWPTADLVDLITAVGGALPPPWEDEESASGVFHPRETGFTLVWAEPLVNGWIRALADRVDEDAISALSSLAADPSLERRRHKLLQGVDTQARKRRIEAYRAPSVRSVREALTGGPPAGPADLAALVSDKTRELAVRIRDGNTDIWQQFWHSDSSDDRRTKVVKPKSENDCRKVLLSHLGPLLELYNVMLEPEGSHAEEKRSDIVAIHAPHAIPIEIKKTGSRDLWTAIQDQLIPRYLRDPRCGGYGVFLVFWHGHERPLRSPHSGRRPKSARELGKELEKTLSAQLRRTITVIVLDVSAPHGHHRAPDQSL